ncbi:hypothetical protein SS50377_22765 [Spironucleus salmonicida]|uniref:Uncharacterized protein n=1 Tax=Spironucleus salmonicida TaxID=348837 RepID=V6LNG8_9EUKA|nr:hypothetical protein SS50377_22765 [Spironucleus salmonicida]|eukprot:EST42279.1 Hypothetical protein SS50377_18147 [Spironucleus salmonicida]
MPQFARGANLVLGANAGSEVADLSTPGDEGGAEEALCGHGSSRRAQTGVERYTNTLDVPTSAELQIQ